jgi:hypothetical protein
MTRDELRAKCIEAIARCLGDRNDAPWQEFIDDATAAFDALNSFAVVRADEHRAKCIDAMIGAYVLQLKNDSCSSLRQCMTAAFDALHGIARVNPIEATEEMCQAAATLGDRVYPGWPGVSGYWDAMSAAGDLTMPPGNKP